MLAVISTCGRLSLVPFQNDALEPERLAPCVRVLSGGFEGCRLHYEHTSAVCAQDEFRGSCMKLGGVARVSGSVCAVGIGAKCSGGPLDMSAGSQTEKHSCVDDGWWFCAIWTCSGREKGRAAIVCIGRPWIDTWSAPLPTGSCAEARPLKSPSTLCIAHCLDCKATRDCN
jgi:hypothetical protein